MNNEDIRQTLIAGAKAKGICADGYAQLLGMENIDEMVGYYLAHPNWCMERNYPMYAYIKKHFTDLEGQGIFVGKAFHGELLNDRQVYVFHKCTGTIKVGLNVEKAIIPMLYLANGCKLRIIGNGEFKPKNASDRSIVPIFSFGKNDVRARENRYVVFSQTNAELI